MFSYILHLPHENVLSLSLSLSHDGVILWKEAWRLEFFMFDRIMVLRIMTFTFTSIFSYKKEKKKELWHLPRVKGLSYLLENRGNKLEREGKENYEHKS